MIQVIPAMDIMNGRCVRLQQGRFEDKTEYSVDPVEQAHLFKEAGFKFLHLVDLDGARQGHIVNWSIIRAVVDATGLVVDFGGGLKTSRDLQIAFDSGATRVNCGSVAIHAPQLLLQWLQTYGNDKIILSADTRDGWVYIDGWKTKTNYKLSNLIRHFQQAGLTRVTTTAIDRDGMMEGPDLGLYRELLDEFPKIRLTASGGVTSITDIEDLNQLGVESVIVGKALYEGVIGLDKLSLFTT